MVRFTRLGTKATSLLLALSAVGPALAAERIDWPMFGLDASRTGRSPTRFESTTLGKAWATLPPRELFIYVEGVPYWSSPSLATVEGEPRVFIGCYDRNVYAFDGATGAEAWTYTTGDAVGATPTYAVIGGRPMLFVASSDRSVYALDPSPKLGRQADRVLWQVETFPWRQTVNPARMANPLVADIDGKPVLFCGVWNNDQSGTHNVQQGEVIAFAPKTGDILWRRVLGTGAINTPCFGTVGGEPALFVPYEPGAIFAISARDGRNLWPETYAAAEELHGGISVATVGGRQLLFFGGRTAWAYAVAAETGKQAWDVNVGTWVDSTPAVAEVGGRPLVFFGTYTYFVVACDAATGEIVWRHRTRGIIQGSPAVATMGEEPVVCVNSLDDHVYVVRAAPDDAIADAPFALADIKDVRGLAAKVDQSDDAVARYLAGKLEPDIRRQCGQLDPKQPVTSALQRALVDALNRLREDPSLYDPQRFADVPLDARTRELLDRRDRTKDLARLNRVLLEAALPDVLQRSRFLFRHHLGKFPWTHYLKGRTIWSSCVVGTLAGRPTLVAPSYSGVVSAFTVGGDDANVGVPRESFWDALGVAYTIPVLVVVALVLALTFFRLLRRIA